MQEAYGADDLHRARVLYLKIQGIDVTSDDDPRIAEVRDEDFVFVPGGQLVLDDESIAALQAAERREIARREKDGEARKWKERELAWEAEVQRVRMEKAKTQRLREEALRVQQAYKETLAQERPSPVVERMRTFSVSFEIRLHRRLCGSQFRCRVLRTW